MILTTLSQFLNVFSSQLSPVFLSSLIYSLEISPVIFHSPPPPLRSCQTSGQTELENWITAIHSACAAALARQHHREDTVRLLRTEIRKLEQKIDMDEKMKKMGDMQLSTVTDTKKRKTILEQV